MASRKNNWILFVVTSLIVLAGALIPGEKLPRFIVSANDKSLHGIEYFFLFLTAHPAFDSLRKRAALSDISLYAFLYCAFWGALTEILQHYVPGRSADWKDWYADLAGAGLAFLVMTLAAICEELFVLRKEKKNELL